MPDLTRLALDVKLIRHKHVGQIEFLGRTHEILSRPGTFEGALDALPVLETADEHVDRDLFGPVIRSVRAADELLPRLRAGVGGGDEVPIPGPLEIEAFDARAGRGDDAPWLGDHGVMVGLEMHALLVRRVLSEVGHPGPPGELVTEESMGHPDDAGPFGHPLLAHLERCVIVPDILRTDLERVLDLIPKSKFLLPSNAARADRALDLSGGVQGPGVREDLPNEAGPYRARDQPFRRCSRIPDAVKADGELPCIHPDLVHVGKRPAIWRLLVLPELGHVLLHDRGRLVHDRPDVERGTDLRGRRADDARRLQEPVSESLSHVLEVIAASGPFRQGARMHALVFWDVPVERRGEFLCFLPALRYRSALAERPAAGLRQVLDRAHEERPRRSGKLVVRVGIEVPADTPRDRGIRVLQPMCLVAEDAVRA